MTDWILSLGGPTALFGQIRVLRCIILMDKQLQNIKNVEQYLYRDVLMQLMAWSMWAFQRTLCQEEVLKTVQDGNSHEHTIKQFIEGKEDRSLWHIYASEDTEKIREFL